MSITQDKKARQRLQKIGYYDSYQDVDCASVIRKQITEQRHINSFDDQKLSSIIGYLTGLKEYYGDVVVTVEEEDMGYNSSHIISYVTITRDETDEEFSNRCIAFQKMKYDTWRIEYDDLTQFLAINEQERKKDIEKLETLAKKYKLRVVPIDD